MTHDVLYKVLSMIVIGALGWVASRRGWLGKGDVSRILGNTAFATFVPALLFRTSARLDFSALPWLTLLAFFVPALALLLTIFWRERRRSAPGSAVPAVRAFSVCFGNSVQIGIPLASALFGQAGLEILITIVSVHALVLLASATTMVELDLARSREGASLWSTMSATVRNTIIHPAVLPVLAGLAWNLSGIGIPKPMDEFLLMLSAAAVPLCLLLIGVSLAQYGLNSGLREAARLSAWKLVAMPTLVLVVAHWVFGLAGMPLSVVVMLAALPIGSNPLIFAQRYGVLEAETTAAITLSTLAFGLTGPLWLLLLAKFTASAPL